MKVSTTDQQGDAGLFAVAAKFSDEFRWIFREQPRRDLGIDAIVEIVEDGVSNGELIALQVKSGDSWFRERTASGIVYRFDDKHYVYWKDYPLPVMVVLHRPEDGNSYWQVLNDNTATNTGQGWKVEVPLGNDLSIQNKENIKGFAKFDLPENCYSLAKCKDISHGGAKRYEGRIILNRQLSRGEVLQIINKVTNELRNRDYNRSRSTQNTWRGGKADVVWLYVYPCLEDEKDSNYLCRSQWISPKLDACWRPVKWTGIEIGDDLVIDWSENYRILATWRNSVVLTKEDYLQRVEAILLPIMKHAEKAIDLTARYNEQKIDATQYLYQMQNIHGTINVLYLKGTAVGGAPLECKDFSQTFQSLIALADNIVLPFSELGLEKWPEKNREYLVRRAIKDYLESVTRMQYEYEKLQ